MPFWIYLYALLFWPILAVAVGAALRWGGKAERRAALIYAAACCLEVLLWSSITSRWSHIEIGVAIVDVGLAIGLTVLTIRYGLIWLYAVTAIQILMALSHVIKLILPNISRMTYSILDGAGGYPQVLLLILGTVLHVCGMRRRRQPSGTQAESHL